MKPTLRIPKWRNFQHYKDRHPIWIKAHTELLLDDEWQELSDASKGHLFALWLIAANYNGKIPFKPGWISRQVGAQTAINWRELAESKFVALNKAAADVLAEAEHDDSLRALAREEKEEDQEENPPVVPPSEARNEIPEEYAPSPEERKWARENHGLSESEITAETLRFVQHHRAKGNRFKRPGLAWKNWISGRFVGGHKGRGNGPIRTAPLQTE